MEIESRTAFTDSQTLLDELYEAVRIEESELSGGEKLGIGARAVDDLRRTKIN